MDLRNFKMIVYEEKCNLKRCLTHPWLLETMTAEELMDIIPKIKSFMECKNLRDFEVATNLRSVDFIEYFLMTSDDYDRMEKQMTEFEIYMLSFILIQQYQEDMKAEDESPEFQVCP